MTLFSHVYFSFYMKALLLAATKAPVPVMGARPVLPGYAAMPLAAIAEAMVQQGQLANYLALRRRRPKKARHR